MKVKWATIFISSSIFVVLVLLSFTVWAYAGPCNWVSRLNFTVAPVEPYEHRISKPKKGEDFIPFAAVGDTQRTSFWECLIGREVNDEITPVIIKGIVGSKAKFLVFVGDMVFDGGNKRHWQLFDNILLPVRIAKLPLLPIMGNHEYWGNRASSKTYVKERFPEIRNGTWYSKRNGVLGMIFLNSNHAEMSESLWMQQISWLKEILRNWSVDDRIRGIIAFAHHPPYTNSVVVSSDIKMRSDIVKLFCNSNKAMVMVSGHAHGYERFENVQDPSGCANAMQFIVSGGGGGPRPKGLKKELKDSYISDSPRPFNFLLFDGFNNGVRISTHGLHKGQSNINLLEQITMKYPT